MHFLCRALYHSLLPQSEYVALRKYPSDVKEANRIYSEDKMPQYVIELPAVMEDGV
jgi:hypothetical protein